MLVRCITDQYRWLMNGGRKEFLLIFYELWYTLAEQQTLSLAETDTIRIKKCHENLRDFAIAG